MAAIALVAVVGAPVVNAVADPPTVTITSPSSGSVTSNPTPSFGGLAEEGGDELTLTIYSGLGTQGPKVQTLTSSLFVFGGGWELVPEHLIDGTYTAQATQTNLALELGTSAEVTFTVNTAPPTVTLNQPLSPSNNTTPSFSGTASDTTGVTVQIYAGGTATGTPVSTATASGTGAGWTSGEASPALEGGQYTAVATQESSLGNPTGVSKAVIFNVETASPTVTLNQPPSPSNDTTPSFTGTASDTSTVSVQIYGGSTVKGSPVATASATGDGGGWSSGPASPALVSGEYTAVATQLSSVGNPAGVSKAVTFTVNTTAPTVTLSKPLSPTNNTTPSFTGTASDTTPVSVQVYAGANAEGPIVVTATATHTGGKWTSTAVSPPLASGEYTAVATQESSLLGNPAGVSAAVTFVVDTSSPTVTLNQPRSPSNNTTPSFSGTASDTTGVTVQIYAGGTATGTPVSTATASGTGAGWTSDEASPALEGGQYTAVATQESSLRNPTGVSKAVIFNVETASPTVTLSKPESPSNHTTPTFTGFASDTTPVSVQIYAGSTVKGSAVATAIATGTGGGWTSGPATPALLSGEYTAVATQLSSVGNPPGVSARVTFIINTAAPAVTLNKAASPSKNTTPAFTGTASDTTPVTVQVYSGSKAEGPIFSTAAATRTGGAWTSGPASPALPSGQYTAVAIQESSLLGNPTGVSTPVTFVVDTSSPTVTLNQPPTPSNNTAPSFTGTASATTNVKVHIYAGAPAKGSPVSTAEATGTGGTWTSGKASPALPSGVYSAVATQESPIGNPDGRSVEVMFTVETAPPKVTLTSPAVRSNNTTPSFSGTASDTTSVAVKIYAGATVKGASVAEATAAGTGGAWTSGPASPALANGEYTAVASQPSSLGNLGGASSPVTFSVNTSSPTVTLGSPKSPSNNTTPSFTGTASESTQVAIQIYAGAVAKGTVVATATATGTGGAWTSGPANTPLSSGQYTAIASQPSSFGNPAGVSAPVTFIVETASPKVTLSAPKSPSNDTTPSFTGTASDTTPVNVAIYAGTTATGAVVSTATVTPTAGAWTSADSGPALSSGVYTATATQASSAGNPDGVSAPVTFTVETASPMVTLTAPASPSNNTTPSFSGTASDTTTVTVHIYAGTTAEGPIVTTATAAGDGAGWTSGHVSPGLSSGKNTYTAVATQESSLGNPTGVSAPVTFTVDTTPPTVTLNQPESPANNTTPSFTGTATDNMLVTVKIYSGSTPTGPVVAEATAVGTGGTWTSGSVSLLSKSIRHTYTAIATQPSSLGNPAGTSAPVTFEVDTAAPKLTMSTPPLWSDGSSPTFTGTTNEASTVVVNIYAGATVSGSPVSTAVAPYAGSSRWTSGGASPALADGQYTAIATQETIKKGDPARTLPFTFTVDTVPPRVTLTTPANGTTINSGSQQVKGSAGTEESDLPGVTVELFSGSTIAEGQAPVQSIVVTASAGGWSTTVGGLSPGTYTVRAQQSDEAGNVGLSEPSTFTVTGQGSAITNSQTPGPVASFTWFPTAPQAHEAVSLASSSTDATSPITAFAWDLTGIGPFAAGGQVITTTFTTAGNHVVRLRVTDANGLSSVVTETIPVTSSLPLMQPFPVVRIASTDTASGVRISLLRVQAAAGARISVACKGRGCPKAQSRIAAAGKPGVAPIEFKRFERRLRAGVVLQIRVTKAGEIGKYTSFTVRRGRLPKRVDTCLGPTGAKPIACPS